MKMKDLLTLDVLKEINVLAGDKGLNRAVLNTTFIDAPDGYKWCKKGDFILTTGYPFINDDWQNDLLKLIELLVEKNVSAVGIKLGRFIPYVPETVIDFANRMKLPILSLPNNLAWADIIVPVISHINKSTIHELEKTQYVYEQFQQYLNQNWKIENMPKLLSSIINNRVTIYFNSFNKVYNSDQNGLSLNEVEDFIQENYKRNNDLSQGIFYKGLICTVKWINISSQLEGIIIIWSEDFTLNTWRKAAIAQATAILSFEIEKFRAFSNTFQQFRNKFIEDLLNNRMEKSVIHRRAQEINWKVGKTYSVLLIEVNSGLTYDYIKKTQQKEKIIESLNKYFLKKTSKILIGFDDKNRLVLLLPDENIDIKDDIKQVLNYINIRSIYIGIGRKFDVTSIIESYKEAKLALNVLQETHKNTPSTGFEVKYYEDLKVERIIHSENPQSEIEKLTNEYLFKIQEQDRLKGTDLMLTLKTFLENNTGYEKTANKLFIHKNTVRYRINTIEKILQIDLKETNNILFLQLLITYSNINS